MHLGFITPEYPHPRVSHAAGIGTSIRNLVEGLVEKKVKVTLFIYQQQEDAVFSENGIQFHLIKKRNYPYIGWYRYRKLLQGYINKQIISENIDAIEAPDWTGITAFMKLKAPLVIRFHGSDTYFCHLEGRPQKRKNRYFEKNAISRAKAFIAPTTYAGKESARLFGIPPGKVRTIHYGLDLSNFSNDAPADYVPKRLINVGTIIRKKGVFSLAAIFSAIIEQVPEAELILIGSDAPDLASGQNSTWNTLQDFFSEKALKRVHYLGKVPYDEVKTHIKQANVCVFPSLAETLGMVSIEAMALQKAVVNTNYGWAEELIDHGINGYKIDPFDIDAYVTTIIELFNEPERVQEIGKEGRKKIELTFALDQIVEQNIQFYKDLLK
ncbi:MAG: glycosyltransferase family 1 protein [Flavobacterium sp.]|nr:MAG: glycosyltransferase family 1 protein [Flavobacterium sp.]